jgi:hypothetical protein
VVVEGQVNVLRRNESYDFASQLRTNVIRTTFGFKGLKEDKPIRSFVVIPNFVDVGARAVIACGKT